MPCTTHASIHSAPLRKKSDALRSSARSGYLMRRLRHAVSRPCDAICAVLEPSAVLRLVRCGWCCSHTSGSATCLIADALSSLPRACGASALQLAAAGAPWAASLADAFGCDTVGLVLFPEASAPASASTTDMADAHTERCMGVPRVSVADSTDVECGLQGSARRDSGGATAEACAPNVREVYAAPSNLRRTSGAIPF